MIGSDAYCMMSLPVVVSPVKAILAMRLFDAKALPISPPGPLITFRTPGGSSLPTRSAKIMMLSGVLEAGLITTQLPAPMAGASFHAAISNGKFQGMICPTTPMGSLK